MQAQPIRRTAFVLVAVSSVALASGCGSDVPEDLSLVSAKPEIVLNDAPPKGASVGDVETFHASVTDDGKAAGELYGSKLLVALPGTGGAPEGSARYQNQMTFVLEDGSITVQGVQDLPVNQGKRPGSGASETRAVTGGTGEYEGVSGTVKATTQADGSRTQQFSFDR